MSKKVGGGRVSSGGLIGDVMDQSGDIFEGGGTVGEPASRGVRGREPNGGRDSEVRIRLAEPIDDGRRAVASERRMVSVGDVEVGRERVGWLGPGAPEALFGGGEDPRLVP